ncbi:MAG TPA: hypothetical protein VF037_07615, partial [Gemmatimonadales bacterium]
MQARRLFLLTGLLAPAGPLAAQATADQARLVFSVNAGFIPGASAWEVSGQPLVQFQSPDPPIVDEIRITRRIRSTLTF